MRSVQFSEEAFKRILSDAALNWALMEIRKINAATDIGGTYEGFSVKAAETASQLEDARRTTYETAIKEMTGNGLPLIDPELVIQTEFNPTTGKPTTRFRRDDFATVAYEIAKEIVNCTQDWR